jgi:hypothetical protein
LIEKATLFFFSKKQEFYPLATSGSCASSLFGQSD